MNAFYLCNLFEKQYSEIYQTDSFSYFQRCLHFSIAWRVHFNSHIPYHFTSSTVDENTATSV